MSSSEKYNIWFSVAIEHEYYGTQHCPVQLQASPDSAFIFRRYNILCRKVDKNKWIFLSLPFSPDDEDIACLHFDLLPQNNIIYYVTGTLSVRSEEKNCEIKKSPEINKWMEVTVPFKETMEDIIISFGSKSKYWEFLIINRSQKDGVELKIEEKQRRVAFNDAEIVENPAFGKAYQIKTTDMLKMKEIYDYAFRLFEVKNTGERLISGHLPAPSPMEASILSPDDTITTYFYI